MQELNSSLTHLHTNLSKVREESSALEQELQAIRSEVTTERAEKERQGKTLGAMRSRDEVDLKELQNAIGWKIEGSGRKLPLPYLEIGADGSRGSIIDEVYVD
jgi:kinetochore protein Spc25